ncbi:MAG: hypothetical protein II075_10925 [Bacteroidales bacterium]|nr:hypothetical protein [Bacteroidales bacterium]
MMDREEYIDDMDTMTDVEGDEMLNPDYDRVSGSGEMPSLEEFLGVNHASDGLGASSDPFGMVIGDPMFAEGSMGGSFSSDGALGANGESYENTGTQEEDDSTKYKNVRFNGKTVLNGTFFRSLSFTNNIPFILVLIGLGMLHVANRNNSELLMREERALQKEVREYRAESIIIAANLMGVSKVTEVSNLVKERKLSIRAVKTPPMQFVIDKFVRADSLVQESPNGKMSYDDDFIYSPKN